MPASPAPSSSNMKPSFLRPVLLVVTGLLISAAVATAGFSDEQYQQFDHLVDSVRTGLKEDAGNIDALLQALGDAYDHSGYSRDAGSRDVYQRLSGEGGRLKGEIAKLDDEVAGQRLRDRDPAVMLWLLSREQAVSFRLYKWSRSVTEITDLANASAHRRDPAGGRLSTLLMQEGEAQQDTLGTAIQVLAVRVLVPAATSTP